MAHVELVNLSKSFGAVKVLHDLNLVVEEGEFVALVGPSGCGKSTLLRIIAGLDEASGGEVLMDGEIVNDLTPRERNIAMVFQSYALYPHMTVEENIGFNLRISGISKSEIRARARAAAETLGLTDLLKRKPSQLSGGQRQRVAMGRAIVRNPDAFLFDEPLSNLDAKLRSEMRDEIKRLHHKAKTTSIYVTHDQIEAMTLADRVVILKSGVIQQIGTPSELYLQDGTKLRVDNVPADIGSEVQLGLRPENLYLASSNDANSMPAQLDMLEPTGAVNHLKVGVGGKQFTVVDDTLTELTLDAVVHLAISPEHVHVFNRAE